MDFLKGKEFGVNINELKGKYKDYLVVTFVRDPLSRFFSSYEEMFVREVLPPSQPPTQGLSCRYLRARPTQSLLLII
jgi:hypothetical protein